MRPGRHEQRVHEIGIAIQRRVAGGEADPDLVLARRQDRRGQEDVAVGHPDWDVTPGNRDRGDVIGWFPEVQGQRRRGVGQREADRDRAGDRYARIRWNDDVEVVAE